MSVNNLQGSAPPPPKKGMGPLGWIAIGCGVIIVLCIIGFGVMGYFVKRGINKFAKNPTLAAAEMVVTMNPDLEMVSKDEAAGTITVKNKKTGETMTLNASDIKNGKVSFKSDKGSMTVDTNAKDGGVFKVTDEKGHESVISGGAAAPKNLPSFVPTYPGGTSQGTFDAVTDEGHSGAFTVSTKDSVEQVMTSYEAQMKSAGLKVQKSTFSAAGKDGGSVTGKSDDDKKQVGVMVSSDNGTTQAVVTFSDKH
jgi:uncharacterized protein YneF (UPF0154 family)